VILRLFGLASVSVLILSGCYTSHVRTPFVDAADFQLDRQLEEIPAFEYKVGEVPFTNHVEGFGATRLYEHRALEIPSVGDNNQPGNLVTASYYRSVLPGSHPLVIVLPIWGTYTYPSRKMSKFIQTHSGGSAHVLHVHGERYLVNWEELAETNDEDEFLDVFREGIDHQRVTMIDIQRLVDWAEQRPEIDAFFNDTATTEIYTIIAYCAGQRLSAVREKAAREFGWSAEDLEGLLEPIMRGVDPATYPDRVDQRKILIVDAIRDDCMAESCRETLWESLGRPERLTMKYDHKRAFYSITPLGLNWLRYRIWEFLEPRLLN
jgi:hypothetical protein